MSQGLLGPRLHKLTSDRWQLLRDELVRTVLRPRRVLRIFNKAKLRVYLGILFIKLKIGNTWVSDQSQSDFRHRAYSNYEDYLRHQRAKLNTLDLADYDAKFHEVLQRRLQRLEFIIPGMSALCIAARSGAEVKAFLDVGCFAVGIDLNPGEGNRHVVHGDFHDIQFPGQSADILYTNSLDHVFDIDRLIREMWRVLKANGYLVIEAQAADPSKSSWSYESFYWRSNDNLIRLFEAQGFTMVRRTSFDYPWESRGGGEQLCFVKS